jgi:Domain of unknown function (DUF5658)
MADRDSGGAEQDLPKDAASTPCRRWRDLGGRANRLMLLLFVELQLADILSTNHALARPGVWEANPLMAISQAKLGAAWWLPKLAVVGLIGAAAPLSRWRWPIVAMISVSAAAVLINCAHL